MLHRTRALGLSLASAPLLVGCAADGDGGAAAASGNPAAASSPANSTPDDLAVVSRASERPAAPGPTENFTGEVFVTPLTEPTDATSSGSGQVTFEAGARSNWHSHPAGQSLIITDGTGWVQQRGEARVTVQAGDVIWTPPGIEHWHGASQDAPMTHIAIQDTVDGANATWLEPVTDEQYLTR